MDTAMKQFLTVGKFIRAAHMPRQTLFAPSRVKLGLLDASDHLPKPDFKLAVDIRATLARTLGHFSPSLTPGKL